MIKTLLSILPSSGRRTIVYMLASVVGSSILQGALFLMLVPFLRALLTHDSEAIFTSLAWLAGIGVAYGIVFWIGVKLSLRASTMVLQALLDRVGDRLVDLPIGWFNQDRSGEAADLTSNGIVFAASAPYAIIRPILTAYVTPATVLMGTLLWDWHITLVMVVALPVMWVVCRWIRRTVARDDKEYAKASARTSARMIEFTRVQPALRTAGDNSIAVQLIDDVLNEQHEAKRRVYISGGAGIGMFGAVVQLTIAAVVMVGTGLAMTHRLDVTTVIPLLVLGVRFTEPITHSGSLGGGLSMARNTLDKIQELMDTPTFSEPPHPVTPKDWEIEFDNVTFGYGDRDNPVLKDLSFMAPAGQMTAIVGPSGSGKTTIIRLIGRFYDPEYGRVCIGGVCLPDLGTRVVTEAVSPVFQDVYLFDGSIIDNIWTGRPDASRDEVLNAGAKARVDEIVERLPGGWDARVGEGGANLSGGERQRVSIARALLKDAPIVLLDEATAALDVGNEQVIQEAFNEIRKDRTLLVVAHRLQTIASADKIIMLDAHGGINEAGTHKELIAKNGAYARYWGDRSSASSWVLR